MKEIHYCFFFFKHKTAYEIRPRDLSSDVCSSDLQQTTNNKNKQQTTNNKQQTTNNKQQTTKNKENGRASCRERKKKQEAPEILTN